MTQSTQTDRTGFTRVTDEMARTVRCPRCRAEPGAGCVYVADRMKWVRSKDGTWERVGSRKGDPCKSIHHERIDAYKAPERRARERLHRELERERQEIEKARQIAKYRFQTGAARALREFTQAEHQALAAWLHDHPGIFDVPKP